MNKEMLKKLSVITHEEQEILNGQKGINKNIYTEKEEMIIDCKKPWKKVSLYNCGRTLVLRIFRNTNTTISK